MDTKQAGEESQRSTPNSAVLCVNGPDRWGVRLMERAPGAGLRDLSPSPSAHSPLVHLQLGDCGARYYFHMFLQEIIEGKYMNSPLFGMLTGYRNVCR
jgi:hypothetical protein